MTGDDPRVTDADLADWARAAIKGTAGVESARVVLLAAEVRALRDREAELERAVERQRGRYEQEHNVVHELQQRIGNALAVCAQLSPSVAAVRAALTGTPERP